MTFDLDDNDLRGPSIQFEITNPNPRTLRIYRGKVETHRLETGDQTLIFLTRDTRLLSPEGKAKVVIREIDSQGTVAEWIQELRQGKFARIDREIPFKNQTVESLSKQTEEDAT